MVCCLICGTGSGVIACIFSLIFSIVTSSHVLGFVSPKWYKNEGKILGIYYTCDGIDCDQEVHDADIFTLCVIVVLSSVVLLSSFLIVTCCTHYRYVSLGMYMTMFFGGWFVVQEILTVVILIIIATEYDEIGWSTFAFTLPGIAALPIVMLILIYKKCFSPASRVAIV